MINNMHPLSYITLHVVTVFVVNHTMKGISCFWGCHSDSGTRT